MIPVSIVTGFLGSGKTTLIQRLLVDAAFARTAVIVNEFGEIGLDHSLLAQGKETAVVLTTGCLCCAMQSDLAKTLAALSRQGEYDRVVVETSGLAEPSNLMRTIIEDPFVAERHALANVVTFVDALHGMVTLQRHAESRRQVALADCVLMTKTDLTEPPDALQDTVRAINSDALISTNRADDVAALLFAPRHAPAHAPDPAPVQHSAELGTAVVLRQEPLPALAVALWLQALVEHAGERLLRVKGMTCVQENPDQPAVIHAVRHSIAEAEWLSSWPDADRQTRFVVIGEDIPPHFPSRLLTAITEEVSEARG